LKCRGTWRRLMESWTWAWPRSTRARGPEISTRAPKPRLLRPHRGRGS